MEPIEFLAQTPPFDRLDGERIRLVERSLEIAYVPRGETILRRTDPLNERLFVIRKGAVRLERDRRLVQMLEDGDLFGYPSLLSGTSPTVDVVAEEDSLVYRIPKPTFDKLMEVRPFGEYFLAELAGRIRATINGDQVALTGSLSAHAGSLVSRPAVFVSPATTIAEAARVMTRERISSILVESVPRGILTDRDLRSRVIAAGGDANAPVTTVMSQPVATVHARASLFEALVTMLENKIHHLPVREDDGAIAGVITDTDLLRHQLKSPLHMLQMLERLEDPATFRNFADEMGAMVDVLAQGNLDVLEIGRIVASLNDAAAKRMLRVVEQKLGPPPCPYAWIVFGSEGRMEQGLLTDQDNALVHADDGDEATRYFGELAKEVVAGLEKLGIPRCPGGFMATRWSMPVSTWRRQFLNWIETPEPAALIDAANFFDFRRVHGSLDLAPLEEIILEAGRHRLFLGRMAKNATDFRPPLGLFRRIRENDGRVDLKKGGIIPIVGIARLYALELGIPARGTVERLAAASKERSVLSGEGADTLTEAFRFLLHLRLRDQLRARREGKAIDNSVTLDALASIERRHLKDAFVAIAEIQDSMALRYGTNFIS
jgi:CBS domain-containing protein